MKFEIDHNPTSARVLVDALRAKSNSLGESEGMVHTTEDERSMYRLQRVVCADTADQIARQLETGPIIHLDEACCLSVTTWEDGTVTVATRATPDDVWGPPVKMQVQL